MFIKIMYFNLLVRDQDKALDFYTKLGFEKRLDFPGPEGRFLTLGFKGQEIELILWKGNGVDREAPNQGYLFVESDDLRRDFEILRSKGVTFVQLAPEDYAFGVRITALDPDGNPVELRQRKK